MLVLYLSPAKRPFSPAPLLWFFHKQIYGLTCRYFHPGQELWHVFTPADCSFSIGTFGHVHTPSVVFLAFFGSEQLGSQQYVNAAANFVHHICLFPQQRGDLGGKVNYEQQPEGTGDDKG